ncbi:sulfatase-like hydrolase/transferase [Robiginitalea sp. M366]|uniref:sulfatase-like hydrolase/transferase n=1 Tax=Robiginitalea aestuariiviva TaxID=3036903 RepID=UPI00240D96FC|nr:sulfatase-like hydrolase/transferase [Robiginitalea aestuariiviva]MDG1572940.1 sulfatase-like hydrolase/transferase [Robiginitalea aestuariiviva]
MKVSAFFRATEGKRYLQDYLRLVIAFYISLLLISLYQQVRLFEQGALDSILNMNLLLLGLHQLGFAAFTGLFGAFLFNNLERKRPGWGFRVCIALFMGMLLLETLMTVYYIDYYELPGLGFTRQLGLRYSFTQILITLTVSTIVIGGAFRSSYRLSKRFYRIIANMFPATIILFSLFLATLLSEKRPVNLNKTQYLAETYMQDWMGETPYTGQNPYPFWSAWKGEGLLGEQLEFQPAPPHVVLIIADGLAGDFVGDNAPLREFAPFVDSLRQQSLYWKNFLANGREAAAALTAVSASLPMAQARAGMHVPERYSLFALLKKAGYHTSFQYGGNSALNGWDRFLYQERVDELVDRKSFGPGYEMQDADAAGISAGFPDAALFERYVKTLAVPEVPRLDVFFTLSASQPNQIPDAEARRDTVEGKLETLGLDPKTHRMARKNADLLASIQYSDQQLARFIRAMQATETYANTLFILTGSHRPKSLRDREPMAAYQVPFLVFGSLVTKPKTLAGQASHLDVAPDLVGSLARRYGWNMPPAAPWMGQGLKQAEAGMPASIPLFGNTYGAGDYIADGHMLSGNEIYKAQSGLTLEEGNAAMRDTLKALARDFRARYRFVFEKNALIPREAAIFEPLYRTPTKKELVWIQSVFNGSDFDKAFIIARDLALNSDRERAKLLCNYILSEVPGHVDTEILLGRINAWEGHYEKAIDILEQVVNKYPVYEDGYAALLDVYYWSGQDGKARYLQPAIENYLRNSRELRDKLDRAASRWQEHGPQPTNAGNTLAQNHMP